MTAVVLTSWLGGAGKSQGQTKFILFQVSGRQGDCGSSEFHGHVALLDELLQLFRDSQVVSAVAILQ